MIFKQFPLSKLENFFLNNFEEQHFLKIFALLVFSLGLYAISWIYSINKKLETIDEDAPDSRRAVYILFIFPVGWALIYVALSKLIFANNPYLHWLNIVIWFLLIFLSLKYLYDFCDSFGKLTRTSGLVWYLLNYAGYLGIILILFDIYYLLFLAIIPLCTIPAMQEFLNLTSKYTLAEAQKEHFKNMERLA